MSRTYLLLGACLATACMAGDVGFSQAFVGSGEVPTEATSVSTAPGPPTWTVLVYGHGDHDLSAPLLSDLAEMARARIGPEINLLVFADWNASRTIPGEQSPFPSGAIWYRVRGEGHPLERLSEREELDFDDPTVLAEAVTQAFTEHPADRYGLILWDHGGGWSVGFGGDSQDGTRRDAPGMSTTQVAAAVKAGLDGAGLTRKRALEFLSFDACLMGGAESITAFQDLAQVYLADAELDYGDGWDYEATFSWLSDNPTATARELAAFEVQAWDAHHREASLNDSLLRSHIAIDNTQWPRFVAATRELVQSFRTTVVPEAVAFALQLSLPAYRSQMADPRGSQLRDLGDILSAVASQDSRAQATAARAALAAGQAARIAVSAGTFREGQLGVHVFSGPPLGLSAAEVDLYPRLAAPWSEASGWGGLLRHLRTISDGQPPAITGATVVSALADSPGPTVVSFDVVGLDAARVEVALLRSPGGGAGQPPTAVVRGTLASAFVSAGRYDFTWNGRLWGLTGDGDGEVPVTVEPWIWQVQGGELRAPVLATRGLLRSSSGEELECVLLVDAATLEAPAVMVLSAGRPAIYELAAVREADPEVSFVPLVQAMDLRSGAVTTLPPAGGVALPETGRLALRQSTAEPGGYLLLIRASDVWGNERGSLIPVQAP